MSSSISSRRFADDIKSGRSDKPPSKESDVGTFVTEDLAPRWIMLEGRNRLSVEDVEYLTKTLGIRTDLDLRSGGETAGMNGVSPMGPGVAFFSTAA